MKAILLLVSLLVLSSVASAQITYTEDQPNLPLVGEQGWKQILTPTSKTIKWLAKQPNGTIWFSTSEGMFRSSDLGDSWSIINISPYSLPAFFNDTHGIAVQSGGTTIVTTDGGDTWKASTPIGEAAGAPHIASDHSVFTAYLNRIARSTNKGETWSVTEVDAGAIHDIHFVDSSNGYAAADHPSGFEYALAFSTSDGGANWQQRKTPPFDWWGVGALAKDTVFLASPSGYLYESTNQGADWTERLSGWSLETVTFVNSHEGFAAGYHGRIFHTSDRGRTWELQPTPTQVELYKLLFLNDSVGFASGEEGVLLRTLNKGKSWVRLTNPITVAVRTFPEPFRTSVNFEFENGSQCAVSLSIYAVDGRLIYATDEEPGTHQILVASAGWEAGVYLYSLKLCGQTYQGKITLAPIG